MHDGDLPVVRRLLVSGEALLVLMAAGEMFAKITGTVSCALR
jgi:hypothetical protein